MSNSRAALSYRSFKKDILIEILFSFQQIDF